MDHKSPNHILHICPGSNTDDCRTAHRASTTLRRLYTQRNTGTIILLLAAILMFTHQYINQQELGDYIIKATPTAWLLPFVVFVAIELYTAIRIPSQHNKEQEQA